MKAERATYRLQKHHPELLDVWGDLEAVVPVVTPMKAEQPSNVKLTLLPFQLESLCWMKKQEKTIWRGGMLAVRHALPFANNANSFPSRMRWVWGRQFK